MTQRNRSVAFWVLVGLIGGGLVASQCAPRTGREARKAAVSDVAVAAQKTYVAPGDLDEYYLFSSGGHSGQVYVYGVPSMRHIATIPVFAPYSATGYGFDDETKAWLGNLTWGDVHHPSLSETAGDYDGRWLYVNDMNARDARVDLRDFKTKQIRGSIPIPKGTAVPIDKYATDYKGILCAIKIDPKSGEMSVG